MKQMLGKTSARYDARTLNFKKYFKKLPTVPDAINLSLKVPAWGVMGNDTIGDCTCAAAGHMEMLWTSQAQAQIYTPSDSAIISAYSEVSGYIPGNPATDNGANMMDVLNLWRNSGIAGHKIYAYTNLNILSSQQVRAALYFFGGIYVGVQLPNSALAQTDARQCWSPTSDTSIAGGHAFNIVACDPWTLACVTWGQIQLMTWDWLQRYCDESYAIISPDWMNSNWVSPDGFNNKQLEKDLSQL